MDMGAYHHDPNDDYPDYVEPVARAVALGEAPNEALWCAAAA